MAVALRDLGRVEAKHARERHLGRKPPLRARGAGAVLEKTLSPVCKALS